MPELPEVEITARRLGAAVVDLTVESMSAPGMVVMKTLSPRLEVLCGARIVAVGRIAKMVTIGFEPLEGPGLTLLVHLMSAGRLQVFEKRASLRDRASRILVRLDSGAELRLREFGTKQRAWAKLLPTADLGAEEMVASLGPEAWPAPDPEALATALRRRGHLHSLLRNQRLIAGIGRSWVDEILWEARLSPFKKGLDLSDGDLVAIHAALQRLDAAIELYEQRIGALVPDKMPIPLQVHRRQGEPCPRCGTTIAAIHYAERITCYCPEEQTAGKVLADRRLSRLLK